MKRAAQLIPFLFIICFSKTGYGQELTLPYLESVYQSSYVNPTAIPDHKYSIGLPALSSIKIGVANTGFTLNNLISRRTEDAVYISPEQFMSNLSRKSYLQVNPSIDIFHFRMKAGKSFFSFHVKEHVDFRFSYPKALFSLALEGNDPYIGEKMDFSSLSISATHYREYALNYLRAPVGKKLTYGASFKLLQGMANINLKNKELYLHTDDDMYALTVKADGILNTSLPYSMIEGEDSDENAAINYFTSFQNRGFGVDLGASYRLNDRLSFSVSALDLGYIRWRSGVKNYRAKGEVKFEGIDFNNQEDYEEVLDSLWKYEETQKNYTTRLVPKFYLTTRYKIAERTETGASLYLDYYQTLRPGFTLFLSQKAGRFFQGVLTYSVIYKTFNNIGAAIMFKPGPVQFYVTAENSFRTWTHLETESASVIAPFNAKFLLVRIGINIVLKKIKGEDRLPIPN